MQAKITYTIHDIPNCICLLLVSMNCDTAAIVNDVNAELGKGQIDRYEESCGGTKYGKKSGFTTTKGSIALSVVTQGKSAPLRFKEWADSFKSIEKKFSGFEISCAADEVKPYLLRKVRSAAAAAPGAAAEKAAEKAAA